MSEPNQQNQTSDFQQLIDTFTNRIEALRLSFGVIIETIQLSQNESDKNLVDFSQKFSSYEKTDTELKISMSLPYDQLSEFKKLGRKSFHHRLSAPIIKRNCIISLVSEFDVFLSRLIRIIFYNKPEILNYLDKQISFKQLLSFSNLDSAKEYILEKEIESVLRESHTEHFKWLETKLGFNTLRKFNTNVWQDFIELTERRNLFVH